MVIFFAGIIRQIRPIDNDFETRFEIFIKATEVTEKRKFAVARLNIFVAALNSHPPSVQASSLVGYVPENSPVGTIVRSLNNQQPIQFAVTDPDLVNEILSSKLANIADLHIKFAEPERSPTSV